MSMSFGSQGFEAYQQRMRRVFLDKDVLHTWLTSPHPQLKGMSPMKVMMTYGEPGTDLVLALVDAMPAAKVVVTEIRP